MNRKYMLCVTFLALCVAFSSCKDQLELHNEARNIDNTIDVAQQLNAQADLSVFNGYVKSTGYDKLLATAQNYTVWAPTNAALANLDAAIIGDAAKLKEFVGNHIALSTYPLSTKPNDTLRIKLLNNKYANVINTRFEEANITGSGQFVKNGVLYKINQPVAAKLSIWDYMQQSSDASLQKAYINALSISVIDSANATIIGYNASGTPIFAPNPPMIARNTYWVNVADLRDEAKEFTYFMLQDPAFNSETAKLNGFFSTIDPNQNASFYVVKDLTVKGVYTVDQLPDTLISVRGAKVPLRKANVVKSYRSSNGIVHVLSALPFRVKDKVPEFKIEGEKPIGFSASRTVLYRTKLDDKGKPYQDIEIYSHATSELGIFYLKTNVPVVKYKVYARAISGAAGDSQVAAFTQRYFIFNGTATTPGYNLAFTHLVNPLTYTETYLGEYTPSGFGSLNLRLTSAASTAVNVNTLILDYLRFEPVLP